MQHTQDHGGSWHPSEALILVLFSVFGLNWGFYAAAFPAIQAHAGASNAALGAAMAAMALTALPSMFFAGRVVRADRRQLVAASVALFGAALPFASLSGYPMALVVALLVLGAGSGIFDVVINAAAATHEDVGKRPILARAHAAFSLFLLIGSLVMGELQYLAVSVEVPFVVLGFSLVLGAIALSSRPRGLRAPDAPSPARAPQGPFPGGAWAGGVLVAGVLMVENGMQQWSAIFLRHGVGAGPLVASMGPAVLAAAAVAGRLVAHRLEPRFGRMRVIGGGGVISSVGILVLAAAPGIGVALVGFALASAGISVAVPMLYAAATRFVPASGRPKAVADIASIGYVGLLGGPAVVGLAAGLLGLRVALGLLAVVALAVAGWSHMASRARTAQGDYL